MVQLTRFSVVPNSVTSPDSFDEDVDQAFSEWNPIVEYVESLVGNAEAIVAGGAVSLPFKFSTATADAHPSDEYLRLSSATQNASTTIRTALVGSGGSTLTGVLDLIDDSTSTNKGYLKLINAADVSAWLLFSVTSVASPSGYRNITVVPLASSSANPFLAEDDLLLEFTPNGDKGATGAAPGLHFTHSTTTTATDPTAGKVQFNNATLASATALYISETDSDGNAIAAEIATWDDATGTNKSKIKVTKVGDPTKFAMFYVTGTNTDNGSWDTVNLTYITGAGTFSNLDAVQIEVVRNGDTGAAGTNGTNGLGLPTSVTIATGNVILTSTATQLKFTPTKFGSSIKFPDATTCAIGLAHVMDNRGDYPGRNIDNTGALLGFVPPHTVCHATIDSIASQAGIWAVAAIQALGVSAQLNNTSATNTATNVTPQRVEIDANRTCILVGGTSLYAVVIDKSTGDCGAPTLVRSGINSGSFVTVLSAASQVMVVTCDSTTGMEAVTLTIDATTGVTVNSGTKGTATLAGNIVVFGQLIAVGTSFVVSYGRDTTTSAIREITLSGTTPTIRNEAVATSASVTTAPTIRAMSSTVVMAIEASSSVLYAKPWTISGGASMTAGTEATKTCTSATYRTLQLAALGNIALAYLNTSTFAGIISLNVTTAVISSTSMGTACTSVVTCLEMVQVSATKVECMYHASSATCYVNNMTDSSGVIGVGTEISYSPSAGNMAGSLIAGFLNSATSVIWSGVATRTICLDVNPSSTSPTFTNVFEGIRSTFEPQTSDKYGVRSGKTIVAGGAMYGLTSTTAAASVSRYCAAGITTVKQPDIHIGTASGTVFISGSSANQSWFYSTGNSTTGIYLSLVEAAF